MEAPKPKQELVIKKLQLMDGDKPTTMTLNIYVATMDALTWIQVNAPKFGNYFGDIGGKKEPPLSLCLYVSECYDVDEVVTFLESYGKGE